MKQLLISLLSLKPTATILFDAEGKTFTQAELDAIVAEKTKASFEAGKTKAQQEATSEAEKAELDAFRKAKKDSEEQTELKTITDALKAEDVVAGTTLNPAGYSRFATENKDVLKGLTGESLIAKVNSLKDKDENKLFFSETNVNATGALLGGDKKGKEETKVEYYPGSSIPKR